MHVPAVLAQADSPANEWLRENPAVLVGIFVLLGLAIGYSGVAGLQRGHTMSKGFEVRGGMNTFLSIFRIIAGFGCIVAAMWFGFDAWG